MLRPTQDYIVVKPLPRFHSAVIDVQTREKHCRGEVIAVGPGKRDKKGRLKPLDARCGDIVAFGNGEFDFYPKWQDSPESETLRVIQEADIAYIETPDCEYQTA